MRFTNEFQTKILKNLSLEPNLNITLSTSNFFFHEEHQKILKTQDNGIALDNNSICNLKCTSIGNEVYFPKLDSKFYYYAIQNLDRFERHRGEISFPERNYLIIQQIKFWSEKIKKHQPKVVIFMDMPHMYYELVLLGLLKEKKIPFMILCHYLQDFSYFLDSNLRIIKQKSGKNFFEVTSLKRELSSKHKALDLDVKIHGKNKLMASFSAVFFAVRRLLTHQNSLYKNGYYIKTGYLNFGWNTFRNEYWQEVKYSLACILYKLFYNIISKKPKSKERYIYFPLSSGFENTLHPSASPWDLASIASDLVARLPEDTFLYVKEHPAQFVFRAHQRFNRDLRQYIWFAKHPKIKLISLKTSQYSLIERSIAVAALSTSSSVIEAWELGKTVHIYGHKFQPHGSKKIIQAEKNNQWKTEKYYVDGSIIAGSTQDAKMRCRDIVQNLDRLGV